MIASTTQQLDIEAELPINIVRGLFDKNPEKRQTAGQMLEFIILKSLEGNNHQRIQQILNHFRDKYIRSPVANNKKIGLQAFTFIAQAFRDYPQQARKFIVIIVQPILECFHDIDQKVKYNSIKALYYICRFLDDAIVRLFNDIFENIMRRISDVDEEVKKAAELLNSTLKTIISDAVADNLAFDIPTFMKLMTTHIKDSSPLVRQYLIDWINTLDQIPSVDLSVYLPVFLEDILLMLGEKEKQLRSKAEDCAKGFLFDLKEKFYVSRLEVTLSQQTLTSIVDILVRVCKSRAPVSSKLAALMWLEEFFYFFKEQVEDKAKLKHKYYIKSIMILKFDEILAPVLMMLSHEEEQVRKVAVSANELLFSIMDNCKKEQSLNFSKIMPLLNQMLSEKKSSLTSESVLSWMKFMLENYNDNILPQIQGIIQKLVEKLCEDDTKNVMSIIQNASFNEQYFDLVIEKVLSRIFKNKSIDTQEVLRKICLVLSPERTYISVCAQILNYEDPKFIEMVVIALCNLLSMEPCLASLRRKLRHMQDNEDTIELFKILFKTFTYNSVSLLTLCYLCEEYQLAYKIIRELSKSEESPPFSLGLLTGLCKMVNLLESPTFISMRLQMLQRPLYPFLVESIYALMMLLPQGRVYNVLKNRVDTVNHVRSCPQSKPMKKYFPLCQKLLEQYRASPRDSL